MSEDVKAVESEWVQEGFMEPKKKRITFECAKCGHVFTRTFKAEPKHDPKCPSKTCGDSDRIADMQRQIANLTAMLADGRGPAHIGDNVKVKAVDKTAEIVMADHKLTDLRDGVRPGETMAPKLPVPMQNAADNFFSGGAKALGTGDTMRSRQMKALGQRALAGAFRQGAIAPNMVLPKERPPVVTTSNPGYVPKNRPN
ncbi:MAG: hypothetical protein KGL39_04980 [Patescibacteria group bacterium]|nr:hypothetical protein [Patescibacteria group bacterium]